MLKKILFLLLTAVLLIFSTSCGEECTSHVDENTDGRCDRCESEMEKPPVPEEESLTLIEDGKATFKIVISKDSSTASVNKAADGLIKKLKGLDITVEKLKDEAASLSDCEVIIGSPESRGEAYVCDVHELGPEGYAIRLINGKIQIIGGSDAATVKAIEVFTEDLLLIDGDTDFIDTVTVKKSQEIEEKQTDFRISSIKLCGKDMKGFTIATNKGNSYAIALAEYLQRSFYERAGYWFEIVPTELADKSIIIRIEENDGHSDGYSLTVSENGIDIRCQFPDKLEATANSFFIPKVVTATGAVEFSASESSTANLRRIYYEDFGADGTDSLDDLEAIKNTHKYANIWGHTVCAKNGATYYIRDGHALGATVKTDTDWGTARFIIDDRDILPKRQNGNYNWEKDTVLFSIVPDGAPAVYTADDGNLPFTSVKKNAANIGFAPGFDALIIITNSDHKAYIRHGSNADNGMALSDAVKVDKDGNIDTGTALLWDFQKITEIEVIPTSDKPITVSGGFFTRYHNEGPSKYEYYSRNIVCTRSNTTITGIDYTVISTEDHGCPYSGFISVERCDGVSVTDCLLDDPPSFSTVTDTSSADGIAMGSYFFSGNYCTNITLQRMEAKGLWNAAGDYIADGGGLGTNFCKNVFFFDNELFTFDSHCGGGNITIKNSTLKHINAIGGGKIYVENTDFYPEKQRGLIVLRLDYGSLWMGEVEIKDCEVFLPSGANIVGVFKAGREPSHDFGYKTCMPTTVTVDNLKVHNSTNTISLVFGNSVINAPLDEQVKNPYAPPEKIIIRNNESEVIFDLHEDSEFFSRMLVERE